MEIKIEQSKKYDDFRFYEFNRDVKPGRVENLKDSILKLDITSERPILVTKTKQIIDGQHRYLACQELKRPVYFMVSKIINDKNIDDAITLLNSTQNNWTAQDYVTHYAKRGFKTYLAIKQCAERYSIGYDNATGVVANNMGRNTASLRDGTLKMGKMDYHEICNVITAFKSLGFRCWKDAYFIRALTSIILSRKYDHKVDFQKITKNKQLILECASTEQYLKQFDELLGRYRYQKVAQKEVNELA